ncbi:hypothetical protein [Brevundimonas sp.]|uniref:hypothetical protein n=1 Tax=Brevundimonas sp. TaxID=1871086 RepID=UPI0035B139E2
MTSVINLPNPPFDNRRSGPRSFQQSQVLDVLRALPNGHIGMKTGEVVDALGRHRDKPGYASVSRTLARLRKSGDVEAFESAYSQQGGGLFYRIPGRGHVPA